MYLLFFLSVDYSAWNYANFKLLIKSFGSPGGDLDGDQALESFQSSCPIVENSLFLMYPNNGLNNIHLYSIYISTFVVNILLLEI